MCDAQEAGLDDAQRCAVPVPLSIRPQSANRDRESVSSQFLRAYGSVKVIILCPTGRGYASGRSSLVGAERQHGVIYCDISRHTKMQWDVERPAKATRRERIMPVHAWTRVTAGTFHD